MGPRELTWLAFKFFWSGKRDLVSRSVVSQTSLFGGFSVVDIEFKTWSLQARRVKRFASSPSGWVTLLDYRFKSVFGVPPIEVFTFPYAFNLRSLPPFYKSLIQAWHDLDGSFSASKNSLVYGFYLPHYCLPVAGMSTKSHYQFLLSENMVMPNCVEK